MDMCQISTTSTLAFLQNFSMWEMLLIMMAMLLLFGRKLPEVGRSLGKGIVEFKKGLAGVGDEIEKSAQAPPSQQWNPQQLQAQQYPQMGPGPSQGYQPPQHAPQQYAAQPYGQQQQNYPPPPPQGYAPPPPPAYPQSAPPYPGQPGAMPQGQPH